ncbi:MAG: rhodanese-like domain-containing protein [Chitinophagaceae bacterium]|nr:rhodanese-like domain-containing protein [Chitinophagaceae bacterium]
MLSILKKLFSSEPPTDFKALVKQGAQIIDVRTKAEYQGGHIKGSLNIPLQELGQHLSKIKKEKPVITCCASGMRSANARSILKSKGFTEVYNGGGWMGLENRLN